MSTPAPPIPILSVPALLLLVAAFPGQEGAPSTSFEDVPSGAIGVLECPLGSLSAPEGHAEINSDFARTGERCLRLLGGEQRRVVLQLAGGARRVGEIGCWAERWTKRDPFAFSIEVHGEDGWREVFDGSSSVRVGARFLTEVRAPVDDVIDRVRFTCTSPVGSGVLIDDLAIVDASPAVLELASVARPVLPVLVGEPWNPVARLDLEVGGTEGSVALEEVTVEVTSTPSGLVHDVALFAGPRELDHGDPRAALPPSARVEGEASFEDGVWTLRTMHAARPGRTHLWACVAVDKNADIDGRVSVRIPSVTLVGEALVPDDATGAVPQRLGLALRTKGDDGSAAFRIPGLVTTNEGTLIAVYDVRWRGWGDLPGDIDVGMMRSTDGGRTWEPQRIVMDMGGDGDPRWRGDGVGDPAILVDRANGRIMVLATWSHGDRSWRGSGPGLTPDETGQLMLVTSDDDGVTWSAPRNLTAMTKDPAWCFLLQGPGRGITMGDGTLAFPAQFQAPPEEGRTPHATVLVSEDHGETWRVGTGAKTRTTESAVVELEDGVLMLNMRDDRGGSRSVHVSRDLGASWAPHPTTRGALIEPVCMASLIHVGRELTGEPDGRLVFSNPNVGRAPRRRLSLRGSVDFGSTWANGPLLLDEGRSAGYSCLTMIDERTVGVLYEGSRAHLTFQRVPLAELFGD